MSEQPWWSEAAVLRAQGATNPEIAEKVGRSLSSVSRAVNDPRFAVVLDRAEKRARRLARARVGLAAPDVVATLAAAAQGGDVDASRALLPLLQEPGERAMRAATTALLDRLDAADAELGRKVRAALAVDDDVDAMSVADLDRALGFNGGRS